MSMFSVSGHSHQIFQLQIINNEFNTSNAKIAMLMLIPLFKAATAIVYYAGLA